MRKHLREWAGTGAALGAILALSWIAPPALHRARHLCPLRSDGAGRAFAMPSFARKYGISCSACHTAYPLLNDYGREFKMNGYVRERDSEEGVLKSEDGSLWIEKLFPWGVIVRSRPFDNGRGNVSNQGGWNGGTQSPNPNGFKWQPLNDVDFFIAGGDAAKHVSWAGELDGNSAGGFSPALGDVRFGYHPLRYLNVVLARKGFYSDDPYQTVSAMQSPTIAPRAVDLMMPDQMSISGNRIGMSQQTAYLYGITGDPENSPFLYYAVGASKDADFGGQANFPTNGNLRLAFDTSSGLMLGAFGSYGHERTANMSGPGGSNTGGMGGNGVAALPGVLEQFVRGGFDLLWETKFLAARAAFAYLHDGDPSVPRAVATDRAAYAELAYVYKRGKEKHPFLMPLIRENWYTTFNGTQQFNYVTAQLAHYFSSNLKVFAEYSADTKTAYQNQNSPAMGLAPSLAYAPRGNRVSLQAEVGF